MRNAKPNEMYDKRAILRATYARKRHEQDKAIQDAAGEPMSNPNPPIRARRPAYTATSTCMPPNRTPTHYLLLLIVVLVTTPFAASHRAKKLYRHQINRIRMQEKWFARQLNLQEYDYALFAAFYQKFGTYHRMGHHDAAPEME